MINLLYCANYKAFDGILMSALSISRKTNESLNIYIMTMDLTRINREFKPISEKNRVIIEQAIKKANNNSSVAIVDVTKSYKEKMLGGANESTSYTPYTLIRLLADVEKTIPSKILYLDTDTMANDDISKLYNINIENYEFGAVLDNLGKKFIGKDYINAGVLLLNMEMIRKTGMFKKAREMCINEKLTFPDQDALNKNVTKKKLLDERFNSQRRLYNDTVIQHFSKSIRWFPFFHTINIKPWQIDDVHKKLKLYEYDDIFDEYLEIKTINKGI